MRVSRVEGLKGLGSQGFGVIGFRLGFWVHWILSFKATGNVLSELCLFSMLWVFGWVGFFLALDKLPY